MRRFLRDNGLSIVLLALFLVCLAGQGVAGVREYNQDQEQHGQPRVTLAEYLGTGHFVESVFENWESEFLQMAALVVFTIGLRQKGSPDSKKLSGEKEEVDEDPREKREDPAAPWPVRRGGFVLRVYEHSLTIALVLLFVASFALHAIGGAREYNQEQLEHGAGTLTALAYVGTARFWFESFQNWQSEFLSVGVLVLLQIVLRQRGSPESKPVAAPHSQTGESGGDEGDDTPTKRKRKAA